MLLTLPLGVSALPEDRSQPIQLEADSAQLEQTTGVSTYIGDVVITQGSMRLGADRVVIYTDQGRFIRLEAEGRPATFRVQPNADKAVIQGRGRNVEYNVDQARVIITQDAHITQAGDEFSGQRIEYDLDRDQVKAGAGPGGRVQVILQPETVNRPQ
ncbi:MAG: lipopolysaccharide transport periplasmic protein LptA [Candidatus Competibacteraceae bacterium]|nr:lipopolysaccharide transport periplasmic protein LptA [Candidatus Competibacteraceae bacterium]